MKRILRLLCVSALTVGATVATAPSASAHTTVCEGTGTMTVTTGLSLMTGPQRTAGFTFSISPTGGVGGCAGGSTLTVGGTLTGWCDHWTATGTLSDGVHSMPVSFFSYGYTMYVMAGDIVWTGESGLGTTITVRYGRGFGAFQVVPIPVPGVPPANVCSNGTATTFQVSGSIPVT